MKKRLSAVDFNDILIVAGLILLAVGLSMISIALSISVSGGLLLALGFLGAWRKGA